MHIKTITLDKGILLEKGYQMEHIMGVTEDINAQTLSKVVRTCITNKRIAPGKKRTFPNDLSKSLHESTCESITQ